MEKLVYAVEGLDRLGKSTLIQGIRNQLGYYEVIHFSKPQKLDAYSRASDQSLSFAGIPLASQQVYQYQHESFLNSMLIARSGARVIFDRWHLGEAVYSPLYRGYSGDYVFKLEESTGLSGYSGARLILLTEDFDIAEHFVDDGESFDITKRREEQELFLAAFERSKIRDKRIICVTDPGLGGFKSKAQVLAEALE